MRPEPRAAAAGAGRGVRRAVRRLVGAADLPRLPARGRARQGRALGRGRRRALRRLLHLCRRSLGGPRSRRSRASPRPLVEALPGVDAQGEPRLQGQAVRARRAPAAARAASRLEGDLLRRRARRAHRPPAAFDPVDVYRARYAETAGAPQLARLQDVDFGMYLVDDLLVKTDRASMAHSLEARVPFLDPLVTNLAFALPTRLKVRGLAKKVLLRKARGAAAAVGGRARPQARLLDPGGGVAPRRAGAVRPRDAVAREPAAPGLLPARSRSRGCSTSTSRAGRTGAASCGGCSPSRSGTSGTSSRSRRGSSRRGWRRWRREHASSVRARAPAHRAAPAAGGRRAARREDRDGGAARGVRSRGRAAGAGRQPLRAARLRRRAGRGGRGDRVARRSRPRRSTSSSRATKGKASRPWTTGGRRTSASSVARSGPRRRSSRSGSAWWSRSDARLDRHHRAGARARLPAARRDHARARRRRARSPPATTRRPSSCSSCTASRPTRSSGATPGVRGCRRQGR